MKRFPLLLLLVVLLNACNTEKKILYLQDLAINQAETVAAAHDISVRPKDRISILVSSKDQEMVELFNLKRSQGMNTGGNSTQLGYTVDSDGCIDFPVLGKLNVSGMSREAIQRYIKERLTSANLVKDPIVTVDFQNLQYAVIGEVGKPGRYDITKDQVTLLDAISQAGDLSITGRRDNVLVVRTADGKRTSFQVDLRSKALFASPVYYIQQDDIIYVQPNKIRAGQSGVNDNSLKSISLWMSIITFITSMGVLLFN